MIIRNKCNYLIGISITVSWIIAFAFLLKRSYFLYKLDDKIRIKVPCYISFSVHRDKEKIGHLQFQVSPFQKGYILNVTGKSLGPVSFRVGIGILFTKEWNFRRCTVVGKMEKRSFRGGSMENFIKRRFPEFPETFTLIAKRGNGSVMYKFKYNRIVNKGTFPMSDLRFKENFSFFLMPECTGRRYLRGSISNPFTGHEEPVVIRYVSTAGVFFKDRLVPVEIYRVEVSGLEFTQWISPDIGLLKLITPWGIELVREFS